MNKLASLIEATAPRRFDMSEEGSQLVFTVNSEAGIVSYDYNGQVGEVDSVKQLLRLDGLTDEQRVRISRLSANLAKSTEPSTAHLRGDLYRSHSEIPSWQRLGIRDHHRRMFSR